MLNPDLFEQLLATYPAERRDLARQVYQRFAEGDSTQFFTQLFLLLDVYAHYAERVPEAVIKANAHAHANLVKIGEEICLLAKGIDQRNLNIANHAQRTDELCKQAVTKCDQTLLRFEAVLKSIASEIDTKALTAGVQKALQETIQRDVVSPFVQQTEALTRQTIPTLQQLRATVTTASDLWPRRVWQTALTASVAFAAALTLVATLVIQAKFSTYYEDRVAPQIAAAEQTITANREAFRQLAIAGVSLEVYRTENSGKPGASGFGVAIEGAQSAEVHLIKGRNYAVVLLTSSRNEKQIHDLQQQTEKLSPSKTP